MAVAGSHIAMSFDGVVASGELVKAVDFCLCNWGTRGTVVVLGTGVEAVGLDSTWAYVVRGLNVVNDRAWESTKGMRMRSANVPNAIECSARTACEDAEDSESITQYS